MTEEELEEEFFALIRTANETEGNDPMVLFGAIALNYYVAMRMAQLSQDTEVGASSFKVVE